MARIVRGDRLLLFFRDHDKQQTDDGAKLRFQTEHSISKEKEKNSEWTKDGPQVTVRDGDNTISISSLKYEEDGDILNVFNQLEELCDNNKLVEVWQVNLDSKTEDGTYKITYYQGYFTSFEITAGDSGVGASMEYAINGRGVKGTDKLSPEQIAAAEAEAAYEYTSIKKLGTTEA